MRAAETSLYQFVWQAWHVLEASEMRPGKHLELICEELEKVTSGITKNLLINMPPRHGKSLLVSVLWPVWEWIQNPSEQYLCVSYDLPLAQDLARRARDLIKSEWFQSRWGHKFTLSDEQDAKSHYVNDKLGARISITVRGAATGKGGTRIIVDDPHNTKNVDTDAEITTVLNWYGNVIKSRKNNPDAAFVIVMQRSKENDLTGHILETEGGLWRHICLPARYEAENDNAAEYDWRTEEGEALWPEMYPIPALDALQSTMDPYAVLGQYQQRPTGRQGGLFNIANFTIVDACPVGAMVIRNWDFAGTKAKQGKPEPARTAGVKMSQTPDKRIFIEHVELGQWEPDEVESIVKLTAEADTKAVPICVPQDPNSAGKSVAISYVRNVLDGWTVYTRRPTDDKITAAGPFASQVRVKNVYLVRGEWNAPYLAELKMFPRGKFKDQVDASAGAYNELLEGHGGGGVGLTEEDFKRFSSKPKHQDPLERKEDSRHQKPGGVRWGRGRT